MPGFGFSSWFCKKLFAKPAVAAAVPAEKFAIPGFARGVDSSSQNSWPDVGKGGGAKALHDSTQRDPRRGPEERGWRHSPCPPTRSLEDAQ